MNADVNGYTYILLFYVVAFQLQGYYNKRPIEPHIALHRKPISELRDVTCHNYGITVLPATPPDTSERAPNPSHAGWYSIYLPRRDGRLS